MRLGQFHLFSKKKNYFARIRDDHASLNFSPLSLYYCCLRNKLNKKQRLPTQIRRKTEIYDVWQQQKLEGFSFITCKQNDPAYYLTASANCSNKNKEKEGQDH